MGTTVVMSIYRTGWKEKEPEDPKHLDNWERRHDGYIMRCFRVGELWQVVILWDIHYGVKRPPSYAFSSTLLGLTSLEQAQSRSIRLLEVMIPETMPTK